MFIFPDFPKRPESLMKIFAICSAVAKIPLNSMTMAQTENGNWNSLWQATLLQGMNICWQQLIFRLYRLLRCKEDCTFSLLCGAVAFLNTEEIELLSQEGVILIPIPNLPTNLFFSLLGETTALLPYFCLLPWYGFVVYCHRVSPQKYCT